MTFGEVGQFFTGVAALYAAIMGVRNGRKIEEVHKATNSLTDRLVETTRTEAFAAGQKDGQEKEHG